jgi:hypothetical protein
MAGRVDEPVFRELPFEDLVSYWRKRWLLGRAERVDGWRHWQHEDITRMLILPDEHEE